MTSTPAYRVLARKYRPQTFAELIGQDALVDTLTNAIAQGRIAHAFVLTGVRGVGKTTTARILARALNCEKGPTASPCLVCEQCRAIAEERHLDVIEVDAASRTGVDDMREIIDGVRFHPVQGRTKVYIIDEVHMLSKSAFNALLKTLEEPPAHVVFIFATTEVRRIPATVLSRCQRFDLRRVESDTLAKHFTRLAAEEGVAIEPAALALVARAADGSVRDGLSLLDQAIARGGKTVTEATVRDMLGLGDRSRVLDVLAAATGGKPKDALAHLKALRAAGGDPVLVLKDMLDLVHTIAVAAVVPAHLDDPAVPEFERTRAKALARSLGYERAQTVWQTLLKGVPDLQTSPSPQAALEMLVLRLSA